MLLEYSIISKGYDVIVQIKTSKRLSCNCLTMIMACVIYWQAKELDRLVDSAEFVSMGFDASLVKHVSPVGWDNVVLYGEYIINKLLIFR